METKQTTLVWVSNDDVRYYFSEWKGLEIGANFSRTKILFFSQLTKELNRNDKFRQS